MRFHAGLVFQRTSQTGVHLGLSLKAGWNGRGISSDHGVEWNRAGVEIGLRLIVASQRHLALSVHRDLGNLRIQIEIEPMLRDMGLGFQFGDRFSFACNSGSCTVATNCGSSIVPSPLTERCDRTSELKVFGLQRLEALQHDAGNIHSDFVSICFRRIGEVAVDGSCLGGDAQV